MEETAAYTVTASSENTGFIFVIQDEKGDDGVNETYSFWIGVLRRGKYTIIVGLMQDPARKNYQEVPISIEGKRP